MPVNIDLDTRLKSTPITPFTKMVKSPLSQWFNKKYTVPGSILLKGLGSIYEYTE